MNPSPDVVKALAVCVELIGAELSKPALKVMATDLAQFPERWVLGAAVTIGRNDADIVAVADVYAAGEAPIVAADGRALARALRVAGKLEPVFVEQVAELPAAIMEFVRDGDVVLTMGAGSIGATPGKLAAAARG